MPEKNRFHCAVNVGDSKVFFTGGGNGRGKENNNSYLIDMQTENWTRVRLLNVEITV